MYLVKNLRNMKMTIYIFEPYIPKKKIINIHPTGC